MGGPRSTPRTEPYVLAASPDRLRPPGPGCVGATPARAPQRGRHRRLPDLSRPPRDLSLLPAQHRVRAAALRERRAPPAEQPSQSLLARRGSVSAVGGAAYGGQSRAGRLPTLSPRNDRTGRTGGRLPGCRPRYGGPHRRQPRVLGPRRTPIRLSSGQPGGTDLGLRSAGQPGRPGGRIHQPPGKPRTRQRPARGIVSRRRRG